MVKSTISIQKEVRNLSRRIEIMKKSEKLLSRRKEKVTYLIFICLLILVTRLVSLEDHAYYTLIELMITGAIMIALKVLGGADESSVLSEIGDE